MNKPHGMTGKKNASKECPKDAKIQLRLSMHQKNKFTRHAQNLGLTLSAWLLALGDKDCSNDK